VEINKFGQVTLTETEAINALYSGSIQNLSGVFIDDVSKINQYNKARKLNADKIPELTPLLECAFTGIDFFDEANQCDWFMPEAAVHKNLVEMLYGMCETEEQRKRVDEELTLFIQHGMFDMLFYLKYLVDTMRQNNVLWGVGRGSSVASYVLYLIGVHRIDSIKYNLDIREFLKEEN
jgi:DNA polymerase III alpha subunit